MRGSFVPASDDGTDILNSRISSFTKISAVIWVADCEAVKHGLVLCSFSTRIVSVDEISVVRQPVSGNVAIRQHSSSARALMAMA